MNPVVKLDRRDFLKAGVAVGGGLVLGFRAPLPGRAEGAKEGPTPYDPGPWVRIAPDESVTIVVNKSEMGQGVYTSLAMLIAEELEVEWSKIRVESAPVAAVYNHTQWGVQGTGGSTSIHSSWEQMRKIGATARTMLIAAAALEWDVVIWSCRAEKGAVIHPASGKRLSYGSLAEKAAKLPVPREVSLKAPQDFTVIGTSKPRLDTPEKVQGTAMFGIDVQVPEMLIALVERPPVFGGKVKSFDASKAAAVPGVKEVVQTPRGVAVVAEGFWSATQGRDALEVVWDEGPGAELSTEDLRKQYTGLAKQPGAVARLDGDSASVLGGAAKQVTAEYEVPFLAHATMEPLNCVVDLRDDRCEIWTGTQLQTMDRYAAAGVSGLKPEQIQIHTLFLGGGFGRRANPHSDFVAEAVGVAKAMQMRAPVKVVWTREDDMRGGYYRPFWYDRMAAGLDQTGNPVAWSHRIVGQSIMTGTAFEKYTVKEGVDASSVEGAADLPYAIPNVRVDLHSPQLSVPVQWWRSVGHSHTAFVVEAFLDELAAAAGKDPYEFRRGLLADHPRHRGVLELAAQQAQWGSPLPEGRGRGIALHKSFGSWVAEVAEVSVDDRGRVKVHRVVCAVDCGRVVNPDIVEAQMESGIVYGLSAALYGAITFANGRVQEGNFDDYPLVGIDDSPEIEVHIVSSTEPPSGVGEPGTPPIAPAVANAVFAATGKRVRRLPIRSADLIEG
jgi:isoquinoline 1-oxidoreductase beta subunit